MSMYNHLFDHRASKKKGRTWAGPVWGAGAGTDTGARAAGRRHAADGRCGEGACRGGGASCREGGGRGRGSEQGEAEEGRGCQVFKWCLILAGGWSKVDECQCANEGRWTVHYEWTAIEW